MLQMIVNSTTTAPVPKAQPATFWDWLQSYTLNHLIALEPLLQHIAEVILLYLLTRITFHIASRTLRRFMNSRAVKMDERRRNTLGSLLQNVTRYTIYFIFIVMSLGVFHFNVAALLAGAGIAGVALGFGAQSLIKDVLTGVFVLFEDQYGVGDYVSINGFSGTVTTIGLRVTRVQAWTGEVEIIPNGQIQTVTNFSKTNSLAVIEVGVGYEADINQAMDLLRDILEGIKEEFVEVVGDVQILGVQDFRANDILLRAVVECLPMTHSGIVREARKRIKNAFEAAGIDIPVPQLVMQVKQQNNG